MNGTAVSMMLGGQQGLIQRVDRKGMGIQSSRRARGGAVRVSAMLSSEDTKTLAGGLEVSRIGIGTAAWGAESEGYGTRFNQDDVDMLFEDCALGGLNFYDTSESYSAGETLLGRNCRLWAGSSNLPRPLVLGTTYITMPWAGAGEGGLVGSLRRSLDRMGMESIEIAQVHFPFGETKALLEELRAAHSEGLVKAVGVCNYNVSQLEEAHEVLGGWGVPLASNQVSYSLLDRSPEKDGVLAKCEELGVACLAHTPLAGGKLVTAGASRVELTEEEQLFVRLLEFVGSLGYKGKTPTQLSLNYLIGKGAIPIVGCTTTDEAAEAAGALGWRLEENDVGIIDEKLTSMGL